MSETNLHNTNSAAGSLLSIILWVVSLNGIESVVKITAGIFAIVASAITIYYTIKNNSKKPKNGHN